MRIKIESYGTKPWGTKVVNAETGEPVKGVRALSVHISANPEIKSALVEFVDFDLEGEFEIADHGWELP